MLAAAAFAALIAADFTTAQAQSDQLEEGAPTEFSGRIVARLLPDGRVETGWLPAGSSTRILPDDRYIPADTDENDRWLYSSTVRINGRAIGQIAARRLSDGGTEFAVLPDWGERVKPARRFLSPTVAPNEWKRSSEITFLAVDHVVGVMEWDDPDAPPPPPPPPPEQPPIYYPPPAPPRLAEWGFSAVSAGPDHICELRIMGWIQCWGDDSNGKLNAPAGIYTAVAAGFEHNCAIRESDRAITCWGLNHANQSSPPADGHRYKAVAAGADHSCAIRESGAIVCWGSNDHDQANTSALRGNFTAVSAGYLNTCALRDDGAIKCWGSDEGSKSSPPDGTYIAVSVGEWYACGIRTDATHQQRSSSAIECWGNSPDPSYIPVGSFTAVSVGIDNSCGVRSNGDIACWGDSPVHQNRPEQPDTKFTAVAAGNDGRACGLTSDGAIECWARGVIYLARY